jgi:hypothetical protein
MARRKVLVEGQAALDARRRPAVDDLEVGGADRNGVDPDQNFRAPRHWGGLVAEEEFVRVSQNPGFHSPGDEKFRRSRNAGRIVHWRAPICDAGRYWADKMLERGRAKIRQACLAKA